MFQYMSLFVSIIKYYDFQIWGLAKLIDQLTYSLYVKLFFM